MNCRDTNQCVQGQLPSFWLCHKHIYFLVALKLILYILCRHQGYHTQCKVLNKVYSESLLDSSQAYTWHMLRVSNHTQRKVDHHTANTSPGQDYLQLQVCSLGYTLSTQFQSWMSLQVISTVCIQWHQALDHSLGTPYQWDCKTNPLHRRHSHVVHSESSLNIYQRRSQHISY